MIKVIYTNKENGQTAQSDFKDQAEYEQHQNDHSELYNGDYTIEEIDTTSQVQQQEVISVETSIDNLCRKAYQIFKRYNRKNFSQAQVQQFFAHADAIKFYIFLDGGSPSFAKQSIQQGILSGYPSQLVSDMMTYIDQAIDLSSLE